MEKRQNQKIFASPPVKKFICSKNMFTDNEWENQLKEWVKFLVKENEKLKEESHPEMGLVMSETATLLFVVSRRLGVSSQTRFLALDIFHRFCLLHIEHMTKSVIDGDSSDEDPKEILTRVEVRVGQQAPLRVLTCLWIASKLTTHKKALTKENVKELLAECGIDVSEKVICKSELRVLEQLKFNCLASSTLPEYVGILVAIVGTIPSTERRQVMTGLQVDGLYQTSLQILEFVFCNYNFIYDELFYRVTGSRIVSNRHVNAFARVRCDKMLLASSAVAAAGWLNGGDNLCLIFVDILSSVNEIPSDDIVTFSACIINRILKENE